MADTLERKRTDAEELIKEVLREIPQSRKIEVLRIIQGFKICLDGEKAG